MDRIFYVQKEGRFSHGVSAVRVTLQEAINEAVRLAQGDEDDYHFRAVYEASLLPGAVPSREPLFVTNRQYAPGNVAGQIHWCRPWIHENAD